MIELDNAQIPPGEMIGRLEHRSPQSGIIYNTDGTTRPFKVDNPYDWGIPHLKQFIKEGDYQMMVESIRKGFIVTASGRTVEFSTGIPEYGTVYVNPRLQTPDSLRAEEVEFLEVPRIGLYAQLPNGQVRPIYDQDSVLYCDISQAA